LAAHQHTRNRRSGQDGIGELVIRATALMGLILVAAVTASGCGRNAPAGPRAAAAMSSVTSSGAPDPDEKPGTIIAATSLPTTDQWLQSATSWAERITYASTSGIDDTRTHVTGSVFVPKGSSPQGGWPIVAFGHPTTGIRPECAPSLSPTLLGSAPTVAALLDAGYVVSVPDYEGPGTPGTAETRPYLDSTTVGENLIDSVRAVRKLVPDTSDRWVALGISQGGQAAWAADELAGNYGSGLQLLGSASLSPTADINGLADAAAAGALTKDQQLALQAFLAALKSEYGNDFNLDDYRRGVVREKWDVLSACQGPAAQERAKVAEQITPDDLRPSGPTAAATLRAYLQKTSLPQAPAHAPMLVIYGGQDSLIPPAWTDGALDRACHLGDVIRIQLQPGQGSDQIDPSTAFGWLGERFNDVPAPNSCPSFTTTYDSPGDNGGTPN
jgi:dienelactone hydrolase